MFVKICGLRSNDGVAAAVEAGADAIGFVFHAKSVRDIEPGAAATAASETPDHVKRVAVMRHPTNDEWQAVLNGFGPDVLQTDTEDFATLEVPEHVERWAVYREGSEVTDAGVFVYEGPQSGAGQTVNWARAGDVARNGNMILAGGLDATNVAEAITTVRPYGVDVSSGVESAPGVKDIALIKEFVTAAKAAGRNL